jgi:hypothetical protein
MLDNPGAPTTPFGQFEEPVFLDAGESVRVTADFIVPTGEYERWMLGGSPLLVLEWDGGTERRYVTVPRTAGEEE